MTRPTSAAPAWYFEQRDAHVFAPTEHVGGGWNPAEQHIAPMLGLLTHLVERDRDQRRGSDLAIGRLSFDILGVLAMAPFDIALEVVRPGRTIELVEARVSQGQRTAVVLRAWLMVASDTAAIAGSALPGIPPQEALPPWAFSSVWPGGFVRSVQARRAEAQAGQCTFWVRTDIDLLKGACASPTARLMGMVDIANGAAPRSAPDEVAFPNLDLTAHLFRVPVGAWAGFDTRVSFGPAGIGLTHSIVHDEHGPLGTVSQCLTVRMKAPAAEA